ncbi:MAG: hypothetical protein ABH840_04665 [Nanoarchaeota archaeon]
MEDKIKEAFERVKNDINEIKGQLEKLVDRVNSLAIEIKKKKK